MKVDTNNKSQIEGCSTPATAKTIPIIVVKSPTRRTFAKPKRAAKKPETGPKNKPASA